VKHNSGPVSLKTSKKKLMKATLIYDLHITVKQIPFVVLEVEGTTALTEI
jgi:hypothetical protein